MNYEQIEKKQEKLERLIKNYRELKNKISSIRDFSVVLGDGYSKSTIHRYFHEMHSSKMITDTEYAEICEWLKNNTKAGNALGGKISQEKYGYSKDELGHFKGGKYNG